MNFQQRNQLLELTNQFKHEKLISCADEHYKGQDWDEALVEEFSVNDIVQIIVRIFKQIEAGLKGEDYAVFPWNYTPPIGESNIGKELQNLTNGIDAQKPFPELIIPIKWLVKYLFDHDLWNKERAHIDLIDIEERQTSILLVIEQIKTELTNLEKLKESYLNEKKEISNEKEAINQFIEQKKQELTIISDAVPTVTNQKNEVDSILKNVQQTDYETRTIQKNHNDSYEQLKGQKENQEKEFKDLITLIHDDSTKLKETLSNGDRHVEYFKSLENFILEKQKEIIELGALAAGAALGGTFGLRQKDINKSLRFWKWAVPGITIIAMTWVIIVFTCLKSNTGQISIDTLLNLVKTIPAFVLMGFVFRQYNKERTLEEEYAFKAAVANTIKAYSDLLRGEDKDENKSRQNMLNDSVKQVQTPPRFYTENSGKIFSFSTKGLSDSIKNLNETMKNIKPK